MSAKSFIPVVKADDEEDLVCPLDTLKTKCGEEPRAKSLFEKFQSCNDRVNSRSNTAETCTEELFDYLHVVNNCVLANNLWAKLK